MRGSWGPPGRQPAADTSPGTSLGKPSGPPREDLGPRFARRLAEDGVLAPRDPVVLALSGGLDSTVLLHLLRFAPALPPLRILAAHFDHGMRPGSGEDRHWVRGLCRAWEVPLVEGEAPSPPASEEEAREARYGFLLGVLRSKGARWVLTGHQADDQAETVLFRILRGTGLRGLAGIPRKREPGLYRPLLPFTREELRSYARSWKVPHRVDPSNRHLGISRNFLRHEILPGVEEGPFPEVRESLCRLARLARENEEAWEALLPGLLHGILQEEEGETWLLRSALLDHPPAVQPRLLREYLRRAGVELDEAGTRAAMEFTRTGASGRALSLPGGARFTREFHRFRIEEKGGEAEEKPLTIQGPEEGSGIVRVGGERFLAEWGESASSESGPAISLPLSDMAFPLTLREWREGDRILLSYGTKKLKKLFAEARVPVSRRGQIPVLVDAENRVLWVVGLASAVQDEAENGARAFRLGIRDADID